MEHQVIINDSDTDLRHHEEEVWQSPFKDPMYRIGLVTLCISCFLFLAGYNRIGKTVLGDMMPINLFLVLFYTLLLWVNKRLKWWIFGTKIENYAPFTLYLSLWLVSCFSLNTELRIFSESTEWLSAHLVVSCFVWCLYPWKDQFSPTLRLIWYGALAWSFVLMVYFALYLIPLYPFSVLGFWVFGLSLHSFIPLAFSIHIGRMLLLGIQADFPQIKNAIRIGMAIPVGILLLFTIAWSLRMPVFYPQTSNINQDLPESVQISQQIPKDWLSEVMLKSGFVYQIINKDNWFQDMGMGSRWGNMNKYHDPIICTASLFCPMPKREILNRGVRMQLLESFFDARHETEDRLWNGDDLRTASIETTFDVHPEFRFAYIEKTMTIYNTGKEVAWRPNTQEALYTFHLPEGAVVSSLSLWINGVEEKGRLTGKSTAEKAYTTIVGRERRDPALVTWREGNKITVRVFPCTPDEKRKFKIGITAPLHEEKEHLVLENFYFQGPPLIGTKESMTIHGLEKDHAITSITMGLHKKKGVWSGNFEYTPSWKLILHKPDLKESTFTFNQKSYTTEGFSLEEEAFKPSAVYLDLNSNFKKSQILELLAAAGETPVYLESDSTFIVLTPENWEKTTAPLLERRFSLFPFYKIKDQDKPLVVTYSNAITPTLKDLKTSAFSTKLETAFMGEKSIKVLDLGEQATDFLHSLHSFRLIDWHTAPQETLLSFLKNKTFYRHTEPEQTLRIPGTWMRIRQKNADIKSEKEAPDHLLRLFAYNNILKQVGISYLGDSFETDTLVQQAAEAYVVSPLSSLIVLESEADYERFGIKKAGENSLGNAALSDAGAVPEPHEWVLMLLAFGFLIYFYKKHP